MARPLKTGLDYFPLDTDIFSDEKLRYIAAKFDELGEIIIIKLLTRIYRNGYYLKWKDEDALLFAAHAGRNISEKLVNEVVRESINRNFFDKKLLKTQKILTSNGIQKRYIKVCNSMKRNPDIDLRYIVSSGITPEESGIIPYKGKEKKGKEIKLKESDHSIINKNISNGEEESYVKAGKELHRLFNTRR